MAGAAELSRMLASETEGMCRALGLNVRRKYGALRVGSVDGEAGGSLKIELDGLWYDHATGEGGDALDLVAAVLKTNKSGAMRWAAAWLLVDITDDRREPPAPTPSPLRSKPTTDSAKTQWLWRRRRPVIGSIGELYLRQVRGLSVPIPATLGFLPAQGDHPPALIAAFGIATEPELGVLAIADDAVKAVQLIKLKPDGCGKADVDPNKIIVGQGALGVPIILAPPNDLLGIVITEGIEDALSIHEATGLGAWAAGGAGRMPALADAAPDYIDCVTISPHRDRAGDDGAAELAEGLRRRGIAYIIAPIDEADV